MIDPFSAKLRIPNFETHPPMTLVYGHWVFRTQLKSLKSSRLSRVQPEVFPKNRPKCSIASTFLTLLDEKSTGSKNSLKNICDLTTNWGIGSSLKSNNLELAFLDPSEELQFFSDHFDVVKVHTNSASPLVNFTPGWAWKPKTQRSRHQVSLQSVSNLRCELPMLAHTGSTTHQQSKSDCHSWKRTDAHLKSLASLRIMKDRLWQKASLDCWINVVHYAMTTGLRFLHCTQHQPWSLEALSSIHDMKIHLWSILWYLVIKVIR